MLWHLTKRGVNQFSTNVVTYPYQVVSATSKSKEQCPFGNLWISEEKVIKLPPGAFYARSLGGTEVYQIGKNV